MSGAMLGWLLLGVGFLAWGWESLSGHHTLLPALCFAASAGSFVGVLIARRMMR